MAKRQQLESRALHLVHPSYHKMLGHLRSKALDDFKKELEQSLKKGEGFAVSVQLCTELALREFDHGCQDVAIKQADWDSSKVRGKLLCDLDAHTFCVRSENLSELISHYENQLSVALDEPVESLLEAARNDTWASIRKLFTRETANAVSGLSNSLLGFRLDDETHCKMVESIKDFARGIVGKKAREEAGKVLIRMKDRFSTLFSHDNELMPRVWTGKEDIRIITKNARVAALKVLAVMAAIRLDERQDKIESVLSLHLMDGTVKGKGSGASTDPLASSTWEEVPSKDTLIMPVQCKSLWRQFNIETECTVTQAISAQEAHKRSNNWLPPPWAIVAIGILGFNEFMLLLKNPFYAIAIFVVFLVSKALWVQLDVTREFRNGTISGLMAISSKFFPTIMTIMKKLADEGQRQPENLVPNLEIPVNHPRPTTINRNSQSFKIESPRTTPRTNSMPAASLKTNSMQATSSMASTVSSSDGGYEDTSPHSNR